MIKKIDINKLTFVPASHENPKNPGVFKKVLFTKKDFTTQGSIQMINWARLPEGKSFQSHYHEDMDEVFIILSGKARIKINDEENIIKKNEAIFIPAKAIHYMKNVGETDVHYIVIGSTQGGGGKTVTLHP